MIFAETRLAGAFIIVPELKEDERGFFARTFCQNEFLAHGLETRVVQCNTSFSRRGGTLRGMHYQVPPKAETKLVRCIKGAIYDVIIDLRPDSATYCEWAAVELSQDNRKMIYVPRGFAHGFQALEDDTEITYQVSEFYSPEHERGIRWDDPAFKIKWPVENKIISKKDMNYPLFEQEK